MSSINAALAATLILIVGLFMGTRLTEPSVGGNGGITAAACTVQTSTKVQIGNQVSRTILDAASNRAWARISLPASATSTFWLNPDEGTAAVVGIGVALNALTPTTSLTYFEVGRGTNIPYVGAVTGITNTGSTTAIVTECLY